jgi:hypothetical protein
MESDEVREARRKQMPFTQTQLDTMERLATEKLKKVGWDLLTVAEQTELRLIETIRAFERSTGVNVGIQSDEPIEVEGMVL